MSHFSFVIELQSIHEFKVIVCVCVCVPAWVRVRAGVIFEGWSEKQEDAQGMKRSKRNAWSVAAQMELTFVRLMC